MNPSAVLTRLRSGQAVTDADLERADRRAFLRGFTVTAAGLFLPVPVISVGQPAAFYWTTKYSTTYYCIHTVDDYLDLYEKHLTAFFSLSDMNSEIPR